MRRLLVLTCALSLLLTTGCTTVSVTESYLSEEVPTTRTNRVTEKSRTTAASTTASTTTTTTTTGMAVTTTTTEPFILYYEDFITGEVWYEDGYTGETFKTYIRPTGTTNTTLTGGTTQTGGVITRFVTRK